MRGRLNRAFGASGAHDDQRVGEVVDPTAIDGAEHRQAIDFGTRAIGIVVEEAAQRKGWLHRVDRAHRRDRFAPEAAGTDD